MTVLLSKHELAHLVSQYENNCAQFILDYTKLFYENDGSFNEPYRKQVEFMNCLNPRDKLVVVLKARQCGISTAIVAFAVHQAYFGKQPEIVIISATKKQADKVMRRIKKSFNDMPDQIKPNLVKETNEELILANGTQIISLSSNPQAARGFTGLILWDESAMMSVREQQEMFDAVFPATTKGGRLIMVSTPFGNEGMFFDFCTKSLAEITDNPNNKAKIKKFLIHWKDVPHIIKAVEEDNLFDFLPQDTIDQEYELNFKADNIEEQYFTRDFILANFRERTDIIPIYTSYTDLGLDVKLIDKIDEPVDYMKELAYLKEKYSFIKAGWDIASTENDSVLSVVGHLKDSKTRHKIGSFLINRASSSLHDTILQVKYLKRIIKVMHVDKMALDSTGLGKPVWQYISNEHKDLASICYAYDYNVEDKLSDFVDLKNLMTNGLFKRTSDDQQWNEEVVQYSNLRLNKLKNSLSAKGRKKDDVPNADMLANTDNEKVISKIMVI